MKINFNLRNAVVAGALALSIINPLKVYAVERVSAQSYLNQMINKKGQRCSGDLLGQKPSLAPFVKILINNLRPNKQYSNYKNDFKIIGTPLCKTRTIVSSSGLKLASYKYIEVESMDAYYGLSNNPVLGYKFILNLGEEPAPFNLFSDMGSLTIYSPDGTVRKYWLPDRVEVVDYAFSYGGIYEYATFYGDFDSGTSFIRIVFSYFPNG